MPKQLKELDTLDRKDILDQVQKDKEEKYFSRYTKAISTVIMIEQGKQLWNQLIEMISRINANSIWNCIGTIENTESKDDDMCWIVKTNKCCYTAEIDTSRDTQQCISNDKVIMQQAIAEWKMQFK